NNFTTTIPSTKQVLKVVNTFKVDTTYFGKDPKRLRTGDHLQRASDKLILRNHPAIEAAEG
ncbi:MAG: hypothetical protein MSA53_07280, partial [Bacteroidales bacterium]|nr:hypothetical protein [Bacteroidales bacterium]